MILCWGSVCLCPITSKGNILEGKHKLVKGFIILPRPEFCRYTHADFPASIAPKAIETACPSFVATICLLDVLFISIIKSFNKLSGTPT